MNIEYILICILINLLLIIHSFYRRVSKKLVQDILYLNYYIFYFFFFTKKQEWNDYNCIWNKTEYGDVDGIRIHPRKLWTPDLLMYNR